MKHLFIKHRRFVLPLVSGVLFALVLLLVPRSATDPEIVPTFAVPPAVTPVDHQTTTPQKSYPQPTIDLVKTKGCIADGVLNGYSRTSKEIDVLQRTHCRYIHRALETWLEPPDFSQAERIREKVGRDDLLYGMFIAEAIDKKANYAFRAENRRFAFGEMCRKNSKNFWGEHTCKPAFREKEYRDYLAQITTDAMDRGIYVFLFGQIYHQDDLDDPMAEVVVNAMRAAAAERGVQIIIGAQTNDITDPDYLQLFDFIEGGVGLSSEGTIENGPCYSRWWKQPGDWCWGLLWHDNFRSHAKNVIVHFDWSAVIGDDMYTFARMSHSDRHRTLTRLYTFFTDRGDGFFFPLLTPLHHEHGGCHGPRDRYYSAHKKYGCPDEDAINALIDEHTQ